MPTEIRPELSKKNKYWIPKHRYYELKHFVMQYPQWKEMLLTIDGKANTKLLLDAIKSNDISNPVLKAVELREQYNKNIAICNEAITKVYPENYIIGNYILLAILGNKSYDKMRAKYDIPFGKDVWYDLYHKFFWLLDSARK